MGTRDDDGGDILDKTGWIVAPGGRRYEIGGLGVADYMSIRAKALSFYTTRMIEISLEAAGDVSDQERKQLRFDAVEHYSQIEYADLPSKKIQGKEVDYSIWWVSSTPEGMIFALWLMMRSVNTGMSIGDVQDLFVVEKDGETELDIVSLERAADDGGRLVSSLSKNGTAPKGGGKQKRKKKRRRKKKQPSPA